MSEYLREAAELIRVPTDRIHQLFFEMGKALYSVQFFEDALVTFLVLRFKLDKRKAHESAWDILDNVRRDTAGKLLKDLRAACKIEKDTEAMLSRLIDDRNWLVHRLQHENSADLRTASGFGKVIDRIRRIDTDSRNAQYSFMGMIQDYTMKRAKVTKRELDRATLEHVKGNGRRSK